MQMMPYEAGVGWQPTILSADSEVVDANGAL